MKVLFGLLLVLALLNPALAVFLPSDAQQVTATASNTATITSDAGIITTQSLTTAGGSTLSLVVQSPALTTGSIVLSSVQNGTNSGGTPQILTTDPQNSSVTIVIENTAASTAFNGTIVVSLIIFN